MSTQIKVVANNVLCIFFRMTRNARLF